MLQRIKDGDLCNEDVLYRDAVMQCEVTSELWCGLAGIQCFENYLPTGSVMPLVKESLLSRLQKPTHLLLRHSCCSLVPAALLATHISHIFMLSQ